MDDYMMSVLRNQERLKVLRELALIDADTETVYDRLTQLASRIVGAPVSLVSMVGGDYQFFKSQVGLPEPWKTDRRTPLSHSFCQHVVATNQPLIVTDAREVDFLKENLAIPDLDVIGYLGMPLTLSDGKRLGSFCVIDSEPRAWTETEIAVMRELAGIVTNEIDLRAQARFDESYQPLLDRLHATIDEFIEAVNTNQSKDAILDDLRQKREQFSL